MIDTLAQVRAGAYLLEAATPRAGDMGVLSALPEDARIGRGMVNQKLQTVEAVDEIAARIARAITLFGRERVLLHPDCGFATFADNPICCGDLACDKIATIGQAAARFR
nr:hypothetical protein [Paracoccus versutus]